MHLPDLTAKRADLEGERTALVDLATDEVISYARLEQRAGRAAEYLRDEWRVRPGDRVATLAQNRTETVELLFACAKLHAILVPLNWRLTVAELAGVLQDAEPVGLVHDAPNAGSAARLREQVAGAHGSLRGLRLDAAVTGAGDDGTGGAGGPTPSGAETALPGYDDALAAAPGRSPVHAPRDETEPWYLLYTSGTTGRPKGVIQTAGMALVNHLNIGTAARLTGDDSFLSVLPQFHTGGWNLYALPMLFLGGEVLLPRTFDPGQALQVLGRRTSVFFAVPAIYQMLADHPDFATTDLSGVHSWAAGGAAMPVPLLRRLAERDVAVQQGMGMTETGPTVFLLDADHAISKAGSVGRPQPFVDVRVVGPDGTDVPAGERGELWFRGPGITPGYWRRPEVTAEAFSDGWLRSGDIGQQDEEGFYYIVDRAKDMYISGGENVYPAEVETVLVELPGVVGAAVVGVPDDTWGEVGYAVLEMNPATSAAAGDPAGAGGLDEAAVVAFCRDRLAGYKVPHTVRFTPELPRNGAGKIQKHRLRSGADA